MTTDYRGPHNEMNLWIFGVNADGTPSRQVLYNAMHVPAAGDLKWSRHELPQPVTCPDGFYLAVSYSEGMASIAMSDGEDPVWPFEEGVNFRNKDYRTDDWACVDASFVRNTYMLRAEGEAEAIMKVQTALADSIKLLNNANPNDQVVKIKALESFEKAADGQATKIIVPSEIQSLAGLAASFKGLLEDEKK